MKIRWFDSFVWETLPVTRSKRRRAAFCLVSKGTGSMACLPILRTFEFELIFFPFYFRFSMFTPFQSEFILHSFSVFSSLNLHDLTRIESKLSSKHCLAEHRFRHANTWETLKSWAMIAMIALYPFCPLFLRMNRWMMLDVGAEPSTMPSLQSIIQAIEVISWLKMDCLKMRHPGAIFVFQNHWTMPMQMHWMHWTLSAKLSQRHEDWFVCLYQLCGVESNIWESGFLKKINLCAVAFSRNGFRKKAPVPGWPQSQGLPNKMKKMSNDPIQ